MRGAGTGTEAEGWSGRVGGGPGRRAARVVGVPGGGPKVPAGRIIPPDQGQSGQPAEQRGPASANEGATRGRTVGHRPAATFLPRAWFADGAPGHTRGRRSGRGLVRASGIEKWPDCDAKAPSEYAAFNFRGLLARDAP
ncbi:hypothetical protein GCM10010206_33980 [Streptomyces cinerochromogenes]|nr:hypothetical protein GCM10010206_33980 [Streptomyces cinerochromogenes]